MAWRSILPEVRRSPPPTGAVAGAWLADIARDATRITKPPKQVQPDDVTNDELVRMLLAAMNDNIDGRDALDNDGSMMKLHRILRKAEDMIRDNSGADSADWDGWSTELELFLEQLRARHATLTAQESADPLRGWREWLRRGFEAGAKNAHACLRLPAGWRPITATLPTGLPTAEPARILDDQRIKYSGAWEGRQRLWLRPVAQQRSPPEVATR